MFMASAWFRKMHDLKFDAGEHKYFVDGVEIPSVTKILSPIQDFSMVPHDVLARAAEFGINVHKACELYDKGTLDESSLDENLVPHLGGWKAFLSATGFKPEMIEKKVYCDKYKYAGTLDRTGVFGGRKTLDLVDIKTGSIISGAGPQTSAYENAISEKISRRFVVVLLPWTFKLLRLSNKADFNIFLSCLNIYNYNKNKRS